MRYWAVDGTLFTLGTILLSLRLYQKDYLIALCAFGMIWLYPLLLQGTLYLISKMIPRTHYPIVPSSRFIYHPNYNYSLLGLEKNHPFDSQRYRRIFELLVERQVLEKGTQMIPRSIGSSLLRQKMSPMYLFKMCYGYQVVKCLQMGEWWLPGWFLRGRILDPMLLATGGSLLAAMVALRLGWAVNLSGGFHHASFNFGGGFCIYPDISLMVCELQQSTEIKRIMIIDLDAHQGNGFQSDLILNEEVYIVDCYNSQIFPQDSQSRDAIATRLQIKGSTTNEEYLKQIGSIHKDIQFWSPQLVIYNAGTDILEGDPLGGLSMRRETVVKRDEMVVGMCRERDVPVVMLLSGGYQQLNAQVIADSIQNLTLKYR